MSPSDPILLVDADNTLWDTDAVFAEAQVSMLADVAAALSVPMPQAQPLMFVRRFDQAIARADHRGLRYPPAMLVRALAAGLTGELPGDAAEAVVFGTREPILGDAMVKAIVGAYSALLDQLPPLLPGVSAGMVRLARHAIAPWVVTEGSAQRARTRVAAHNLVGLFAGVLEMTKHEAQFRRLVHRFSPHRVVIIGDQFDRDVDPAARAGCFTILVPSRFRPEWNDEADWEGASAVCQDFEDAAILALRQGWSCEHGQKAVAARS